MPDGRASPRVPSPCISVCALDLDDICEGCRRSAEEIRAWGVMSDDQRRIVLRNAARRAMRNNPFGTGHDKDG